MTICQLESDVRTYLSVLELKHPYHGSKQFKMVSFEKWACKEILREIKNSGDLPFQYSATELLYSMKNKMDSAPGDIECFSVGADLIDDFIARYEEGKL